jgi:hypothetical protein
VIDEEAPPPSFVVGMGSTGGGIYTWRCRSDYSSDGGWS